MARENSVRAAQGGEGAVTDADTPPIVWIVGYPSSGIYKMLLGLGHILFGKITSFPQLESHIPCTFSYAKIRTSAPVGGFRFTYTHLPPLQNAFPPGTRDRVIYLVRDPVDIGFSSARYLVPFHIDYRTATDGQIAETFQDLLQSYLRLGTFIQYVLWGYGAWPSHGPSWLHLCRRQRMPHTVVPFTRMQTAPEKVLAGLAGSLNLPATAEQLSGAIENWSLPVSRAMEEHAIANRTPCGIYDPALQPAFDRGWRYHGEGGAGYGKANLSEAQWAAARAVFGPAARDMGLDL